MRSFGLGVSGRCGTLAVLLFGVSALVLAPSDVSAQQVALPDLSISVGGNELAGGGSVTSSIKILLLLTLLSFAPAMILCMTSFTRIAVVLGMTRTALGTASLPPNTVITGLALFLTVAIMGPIFEKSYQEGIRPYMEGQMDQGQAMTKAIAPLKDFLVRHAREKDLALFLQITRSEAPSDPANVPFFVAVPAFVLSELNTSVLTSMSMITLPPVVISLPLKLMLFVIVDGWHLIISSLVKTYRV
jgi:flagellar biosynthetic protein FliP